jgi:presenilin-like A22 family membrane protease
MNKAPWYLLAMEALAGGVTVFASRSLATGDVHAIAPSVGGWQWLMLVAAVTGLTLFVLRKLKSRLFLEALFGVAFFFGTWFLCLAFIPWPWASFLAVGLAAIATVTQLTVFHNLFVLLGSVGVAVNFAARFEIAGLLSFFIALVLYDWIVVRKTETLRVFAETLLRYRIAPGLLAPTDARGWQMSVRDVLQTRGLLLGSGDIVVPMMVVARIGFTRSDVAALLALGALFGLALLLGRADDRPQPALPWLAFGLGIPYAVLWSAGIVP